MTSLEKRLPHASRESDQGDVEDLPQGTKVWVYLRHSPGDDQTLESQESAVMRFVREKAWIVDRVFKDQWASGGSTSGRHGFELMVHLAHQKPRPADVLIIWKFARFARNQLHSQYYKALLRVDGWKILSMQDDIPSGLIGRLYEAILDWMNEQFLRDLSSNTIRGLQYLAEQGCLPTGRPPKGYVVEKIRIGIRRDGSPRTGRKLKVDPELGPMVVKAFEMKARGTPDGVISRETGLYAPHSGSWHRFFRSRAYVGEYELQGDVYPDVYPAIVSQELFDAVQAKLPKRSERMKGRHGARRKGSSFFLANGAVCAHCGGRMEGKSVGKYRYYICEHRNEQTDLCPESGLVPADPLEKEVLDTLLNHVISPNHLLELLEWTNDTLGRGSDELRLRLEKTRKELSQAESLAVKAARQYLGLDGPSDIAQAVLHEQEALVKNLEASVVELEWALENGRIEVSAEQVEKYSARTRELIDRGEFFDLREVCEQLCSRIVINRERCRIEVHFPLDAIAMIDTVKIA